MGLLDVFKKKTEEATKDVATLAREVMHGAWGETEAEIQKKLKAAGYSNYDEINAKVAELKKTAEEAKKAAAARVEAAKQAKSTDTIEKIAKEVIEGKWGNGQERKDKLAAAGYDYKEVQALVNKLLG